MKTLEVTVETIDYELFDGDGHSVSKKWGVPRAVEYACKLGRMTGAGSIMANIAVADEDGCVTQEAAAVPVSVMRRALALAEQHDAELAAELRASLVSE